MLKKRQRQLDNETENKNEMTELNEKIFRPFAFFKISASPLAAHYQATQADTHTKACQRAAFFANSQSKELLSLIEIWRTNN